MMEKVFKYGFTLILVLGVLVLGIAGYLYYDYNKLYVEAELPYEKELDEHGIKVGELERVMSSKEWVDIYNQLDKKHKNIFKNMTIENLKLSQELIMDFNTQYEANNWDKKDNEYLDCLYFIFKKRERKILKNSFNYTEVEHLRALRSSRWFAFKITEDSDITKEDCYKRFGSE